MSNKTNPQTATARADSPALTGYVAPERPGYYWLRHAAPIKGNWQPVMVDTLHGVLGFQKFGWAEWMAVSESALAGLEWGGECACPHTVRISDGGHET